MVLLLIVFALMSGDDPAPAPAARELAAGVHLIPGTFAPGRGPDGNAIVLDAPEGLIVVDTGRHVEHSDAILAYGRARERAIAAIINTHWHLDHSSGNRRIKAQFPRAWLYATSAVDRAMAPGGFLARNLEAVRGMLVGQDLPAEQRAEMQIFVDTMADAQALRPDVVLSQSAPMRIAGRRLEVHVTDGAVTDADVWLYDRRTRVAIIGDLVTFRTPFFETACPERWRAALDEVWATPFRIAIAGHGAPMTRDAFDIWRQAYGAFVDCVGSEAAASQCAEAWSRAMAPFAVGNERMWRSAPAMAEDYVTFLRGNGGKSPDCLSD